MKPFAGDVKYLQIRFSTGGKKKNSTPPNGVFVIYTTAELSFKIEDLRKLSSSSFVAIVHQDNWHDYFGPFGGRAFMFGRKEKV